MNAPGESPESSWPVLAARVGALLPLTSLDSSAVSFLQGEGVQGTWFSACSGGADSVLSTLLALAHFPDRQESFTVAHFNHCLRGEASNGDEAFVRRLAEGLGVSFASARGMGTTGDEASLREERLAFLSQVTTGHQTAILLQGHQRDDIAETFLWRLARGAGLAGLAAPRPVRRSGNMVFVRPLLTISREEVRRILQSVGATWREDGSNTSPIYLRNRLRMGTMEAWCKDADREVGAGTARSRRLLEEADDALEQWANEALGECFEEDLLKVNGLTRLPTAVRRKLIARWLHEISPGCFLESSNLDHLLDALEQGERFKTNLSSSLWIETDCKHLRLFEESPPPSAWSLVAFPENIRLFLPEGGSLIWQTELLSPECFASVATGQVEPCEQAFLAEAAVSATKLFVRKRQPGDRLHHLGAPGERKLKDIFIDKKVPPPLRDKLPVIVSESDDILWVPGLPPAEKAKLVESSGRVIRLTYSRPFT
ncbi:MAG: tRNA lysidine(34) synthetase TilS [Verrucomicrobia bacterium]|nr:tRNA lysidine(34) synthetase TilS [Verrucomicrobiota bacterium]MDA1048475.1 tRNA lysidine(34) synthetase TilS [Verrucomicrobiota bacterium]